MNSNKVVIQSKTSKNHNITIRYPSKDDAQAMFEYINTLSKEKTFIQFQGEEISLEDETKYLNSNLEKIANNECVQLLVFCNEKLIGVSDINMKDKVGKHIGVFGISIAKEFRGEGVGSLLMETIIDEATKNITQLEIITLGVFSNNPLALEMYKKHGFIKYGNLPNGVKLQNSYTDHLDMYRIVGRN